jgi:exosortase
MCCGTMKHAKNSLAAPRLTTLPQTNSARWLLYSLWIGVSLVAFFRPLAAVVRFAANNDDASHIFLIPLVSACVIYLERRQIFERVTYDFTLAAPLFSAAAALGAATWLYRVSWSSSETLSAYMLALVLLWIAGFALFFGRAATRAARFSLRLLVLAVPLPDFLLAQFVYFLQKGSTELVAALFDLTNIPFLRQGFIFDLGRFSIEIAQECSGIRSSMAVLILALLAAHFYLRSFWKQTLFLLCSLLIMIVKNGVRIATLTVLALYVNPSFLFGRLHRDGGVVFFLLGLLLLVPVLRFLVRRESPPPTHTILSASHGA